MSVYYNYVNSFRELLFVLILDYLDIQLNTKRPWITLKFKPKFFQKGKFVFAFRRKSKDIVRRNSMLVNL